MRKGIVRWENNIGIARRGTAEAKKKPPEGGFPSSDLNQAIGRLIAMIQ